jgi:hypothetical protein
MEVPKAAVNKYHLLAASKHKIRLSWQILSVKPVAISHRIDHFSNQHLRFGVLRANPAHVL